MQPLVEVTPRRDPRSRSLERLALLLAVATAATPALALQTVEARDGVAVEAILSIKEATRIRIDGAPITDVFGNIHSSNCGAATQSLTSPSTGIATPPVNPAGEIVLECDREKGEIYVRPCPRRSQFDPPCRSQLDPGMGAGVVAADCG
jgi:conjugal transfer pilus assembly protein TraK